MFERLKQIFGIKKKESPIPKVEEKPKEIELKPGDIEVHGREGFILGENITKMEKNLEIYHSELINFLKTLNEFYLKEDKKWDQNYEALTTIITEVRTLKEEIIKQPKNADNIIIANLKEILEILKTKPEVETREITFKMNEILKKFEEKNIWKTGELAKNMQKAENTISYYLKSLELAGKIMKTGHGQYKIKESETMTTTELEVNQAEKKKEVTDNGPRNEGIDKKIEQ